MFYFHLKLEHLLWIYYLHVTCMGFYQKVIWSLQVSFMDPLHVCVFAYVSGDLHLVHMEKRV